MPGPQVIRLLAVCLVFAASACIDRPLSTVEPDRVTQQRTRFPVNIERDFDILFVVDNSHSMKREQTSLAEKFTALISVLDDPKQGLPSIHVGVVSTDIGAGPYGELCAVGGDKGRFEGSQCPGLDGQFIVDIANDDGTRDRNYSEPLADTFACMAQLGTSGCGFEQPLEAMRKALSSPEGDSFVRENAYLMIVIVSDEDDCSASDASVFDPYQTDLESALGPPKSFRCFEFGVECDGNPGRKPGARTNCRPRADSPYLANVSDYVEFLKGLKPLPNQVLVAGIVGELGPVEVVMRPDSDLGHDFPALEYSCNAPDAEAVPPIRLKAFLDSFPSRNQLTSICDADLSSALSQIGEFLDRFFEPCIIGELADIRPDEPGLQPDCVIYEESPVDVSGAPLPECTNRQDPQRSDQLPCFLLTESDQCSHTATGLSPQIVYAQGVSVPLGTNVVADCLAP